ncbi:hypothetical protein [Brucella pituitosa]|uniref:hypothetical protein n=1 Tax=Brucella pituitosa TaxID=571256 RepID=UPI003F4A937D
MTIVRKYDRVFERNIGNINFIPPVVNGLTGLFLLGGSKEESEKNHAAGGANATLMGSAVFEPSAVSLGQSVYLQTAISETKSFTFATVAQVPPAGHAFIGNLGSSGYNGPYAISELNNTSKKFGPRAKTTPTSSHIVVDQELLDTTRWMMFICSWDDATGTATAYIPSLKASSGANPQISSGQSPRDDNTVPLRIGRAVSTSANYAASTRHALDYTYNRALTLSEMDALYEHAKKWFAIRRMEI